VFMHRQESAITKNLRVVEWLKGDLLQSVAALFKAMARGREEALIDALAGVVVTAYVLARRLGFTFSRLDAAVESKLRRNIDQDHEVEKWYRDLSALLQHLVERKNTDRQTP